jgi:hypothetical protein
VTTDCADVILLMSIILLIKKTAKENNVQIETRTVESPMPAEGAIVDYAEKEM